MNEKNKVPAPPPAPSEEAAEKLAAEEAAEKLAAEEAAEKLAAEEAAEKNKEVVMAKDSKVYVCSKMAADNAYTTWHSKQKAANDMPRKSRQVLIKGGSGVINKQLVTPHGVVTAITSEELDLVRKSCPAFVRHEVAGFLKVLEKDPSTKDVKSMASDMSKDKSEQKKESDLKKNK